MNFFGGCSMNTFKEDVSVIDKSPAKNENNLFSPDLPIKLDSPEDKVMIPKPKKYLSEFAIEDNKETTPLPLATTPPSIIKTSQLLKLFAEKSSAECLLLKREKVDSSEINDKILPNECDYNYNLHKYLRRIMYKWRGINETTPFAFCKLSLEKDLPNSESEIILRDDLSLKTVKKGENKIM